MVMQCSRKIYDVILPISVSNRANIKKFYDFLEVEEFGRVRSTRWARMAPRAVGGGFAIDADEGCGAGSPR